MEFFRKTMNSCGPIKITNRSPFKRSLKFSARTKRTKNLEHEVNT